MRSSKEETIKTASEIPDYLLDKYEAIARVNYSVWNAYFRLMNPDEAKKYQ